MILCYSLWRKGSTFTQTEQESRTLLWVSGPSNWPGTGLRLVSVASFSLPLASSSQIDLQPIVHLPSRAFRRETGFLSHISGGCRSLRGRQEWGTATDQVPGHHAHPWSVYNFVSWSTVPRIWIFKIVLASGSLRYSREVNQDNTMDVQICIKKIVG